MQAGKGVVGGKMEQPTGFVLSMQNAKNSQVSSSFEPSVTPGGTTVRNKVKKFRSNFGDNNIKRNCFYSPL